MKPLDRSKVNKILVISLTNIGDVILTFPVIDILKRDFPDAQFSIVISPKAESFFDENPNFDKIYIFDKHQSPLKTVPWIFELRAEHFDLVVDMRNTAIPFMISPKHRTSCRIDKTWQGHMREKHLLKLKSVHDFKTDAEERKTLFVSEQDRKYVRDLIAEQIKPGEKYVVVAPGAADSAKRWDEEGFAFVCDRLVHDHHLKIIFVGDQEDTKVVRRIVRFMEAHALDLSGRISLIQLAGVFEGCAFALVNDSAPMHLASYLNVPVLALFGPTNPDKYGPWSSRFRVITKKADCPVCLNTKGAFKHTCMKTIPKEDVLSAVSQFL